MKVFVGDLIKDRVKNALKERRSHKFNVTTIAKALKVTRQSVYNILENPEMDIKYILEFEKLLGEEFKSKIKALHNIDLSEYIKLEEPNEDYAAKINYDELKEKYIKALEEINNLQKRILELEIKSKS